jgi:ribosomal protein S18 acetylase RimI-like enzyme
MRSRTEQAVSGSTSGAPDAGLPVEGRSAYVTRGSELSLSNPGQLKLLLAMRERSAPLRTAVRGYSMAPFIRDRDVLTIVPTGNQPLRPGDVVAFRHPGNGRLVIHRIIGSSTTGWVLKGDSCSKPDGRVPLDLIYGRVARVERGGRDVRLGLGRERTIIALLSRGPGLILARRLWTLPRRMAGHMLLRAQGLRAYRRIAGSIIGPVNIAPAGEKDLQQFRRIINPDAQHSHRHASPNTRGLVATIGGRVIGFIQIVDRPPEQGPWSGWWIHALWVRTAYRGLGIGEKLMRKAISEASMNGATEILLAVNADNRRAVQVYRKLGFSDVTLPGIEPLLIEEEAGGGRRQITMCTTMTGDHDQ